MVDVGPLGERGCDLSLTCDLHQVHEQLGERDDRDPSDGGGADVDAAVGDRQPTSGVRVGSDRDLGTAGSKCLEGVEDRPAAV